MSQVHPNCADMALDHLERTVFPFLNEQWPLLHNHARFLPIFTISMNLLRCENLKDKVLQMIGNLSLSFHCLQAKWVNQHEARTICLDFLAVYFESLGFTCSKDTIDELPRITSFQNYYSY